MGNTLILD